MPSFQKVSLLPDFLHGNKKFSVAVVICWLSFFSARPMSDECRRLLLFHVTDKEIDKIQLSVKDNDVASLQFAFEDIKMGASQDFLDSLVKLMIAVAVDDGFLTFAEQEFLLFMVDLFTIPRSRFEAMYLEVAGGKFPSIGDPSSIAWWEAKEKKRHSQEGTNQRKASQHGEYRAIKGKLHALGILGLDEDATQEDIRKAYLRLVKVHHPDKYQHLGEEDFREAEKAFALIQQAYEYLSHA